MKRAAKIVIFLLLLGGTTRVVADDYIDDLYYSESAVVEQQIRSGNLTPYYDKAHMNKVIFVEDSLPDSLSTPLDSVPQYNHP